MRSDVAIGPLGNAGPARVRRGVERPVERRAAAALSRDARAGRDHDGAGVGGHSRSVLDRPRSGAVAWLHGGDDRGRHHRGERGGRLGEGLARARRPGARRARARRRRDDESVQCGCRGESVRRAHGLRRCGRDGSRSRGRIRRDRRQGAGAPRPGPRRARGREARPLRMAARPHYGRIAGARPGRRTRGCSRRDRLADACESRRPARAGARPLGRPRPDPERPRRLNDRRLRT